jgi:alkanesulfonate monooxygenase SsuD/methylene tetrahydromethanopterin reductase-like flavin-dependent oxidoreductase (luciferase family)
MHAERVQMSRETLAALRAALARGAPIVPVGTTSVRTCGPSRPRAPPPPRPPSPPVLIGHASSLLPY